MAQAETNSGAVKTPRHHYALRVFATGLVLYIIGLVILVLTRNPNLFPTVVLLGSFLVPATYVAFLYGRRHLSKLTVPITALAFFYGGVLGVFAAALVEPLLVRRLSFPTAFVIGLIEESAKILGVLYISRRVRHDSELDGLILGAAAGMGFAALESMGYIFSTLIGSGGSLTASIFVTLSRGLLSPLGHGTWTAILAGVLFRESRDGRFRINRPVIAAYFGVAILHGLWDGLPSLLSIFVTSSLDILVAEALVGIVSLFVLWWRWREARRLQEAQLGQPAEMTPSLASPAPGSEGIESLLGWAGREHGAGYRRADGDRANDGRTPVEETNEPNPAEEIPDVWT